MVYSEKNEKIRLRPGEYITLLIGVILAVFLYVLSRHHFLFFHSAVELISVSVFLLIFILVLNARRMFSNSFFIIIGTAFLFVALIDLLHILSYRGIDIFNTGSSNLATQLWIQARYIQAIALLAGSLLFKKGIEFFFSFIVFFIISLFLLSSIYFGFFPDCYIENIGLTLFKHVSEYIIISIFLASLYVLFRKRSAFDKTVYFFITISIVVTILSEASFTLYHDVYGFYNYLGHVLKLLAVYFLYRGIIRLGFVKPYSIVFRELKSDQQKFVSYFDCARLALIDLDLRGKVLRINAYGLQALKISRSEIEGLNWFDNFVAVSERAVTKKAFDNLVKGSISPEFNLETTIIAGKGQERVFAWNYSLMRDHTSSSVLLAGRDITREREKEQAMAEDHIEMEMRLAETDSKLNGANRRLFDEMREKREINEMLEDIFSSNYIQIAYLDTNFNYLRVNDAYAALMEATPSALVGNNYFDYFDDEEEKEKFKCAIKTDEAYSAYELPMSFKEKPLKYIDLNLIPVRDAYDNVKGAILFIIDVTERLKWRESLIKAEWELEKSKRLSDIGTLAATVAHELRNPLGVIKTAVYNLRRKTDSDKLDRHFNNIDKKISQSEQIINNLLSYARIKLPELERTNIVNLLSEVVESAKLRFAKQGIVINFEYDVPYEEIDVDPFQMSEVLGNIIDNACQAVEEGSGRVYIMLTKEKEYIVVTIKDDGRGMDDDEIGKIFNPFYTTRSRGTGLGLTISKELVELHDGSIDIKSQKDAGTTIRVFLPIKGVIRDE